MYKDTSTMFQRDRKYIYEDPKDDMTKLQLHKKWPLDLKEHCFTNQVLGHNVMD